jgi:predicted outer membrane repeat protein
MKRLRVKPIVTLMAVLLAFTSFCGINVYALEENLYYVSDFTGLWDTINEINISNETEHIIELANDISLTDVIAIEANVSDKKITFKSAAESAVNIYQRTAERRHINVNGDNAITLSFDRVVLDGGLSQADHQTVLTKTENTIKNSGGIRTNASRLTLVNPVIQNCAFRDDTGIDGSQNGNLTNSSGSGGGAIRVSSTCTLIIEGGEIHHNAVTGYSNVGSPIIGGGAIMGRADSHITIKGGAKIYNNHVGERGGAIAVISSRDSPNSSLTIEEAEIKNNHAGRNGGGGIYFGSSGATGTLTIGDNACICENTSGGSGGGIYCSQRGTTLNISGENVKIKDNQSGTSGSGGGIFFDGTINIFGEVQITDNKARDGGGIYGRNVINVSGNAEISGNKATRDGGGIYGTDAKVEEEDVGEEESSANITVSQKAVISNNTAGRDGGGVYTVGTITVEGEAEIDRNNAQNGGGICAHATTNGNFLGTTAVYMSDNSVISNNTATVNGGGLDIGSNVTAKIYSGTISKNIAVEGNGGGIMADEDADVKISSSDGYVDITGNKAPDGIGGGIASLGDVIDFRGPTSVSLNTAASCGGIGSIGNITIDEEVTIYGNKAEGRTTSEGILTLGNGGGIGCNGEIYLYGTITENRAIGNGGGIYDGDWDNYQQRASIYVYPGAVIANNIADGDGGGIYVCDSDNMENVATVDIQGGRIQNNKALGESKNEEGRGGGIRVMKDGNLMVHQGALIDSNEAALWGGGIYVGTNSITDIHDYAQITNNKATYGGGIAGQYGGSIEIYNNVSISDNTALSGGAVAISQGDDRNGKLSIYGNGITITNNTANGDETFAGDAGDYLGNGGAIAGNGTIILGKQDAVDTDVVITNNKARHDGGGIFGTDAATPGLDGGNAHITVYTGVTISGNTAGEFAGDTFTGRGGGIFSRGGIAVNGGTIKNNSTNGDGGGIYLDVTRNGKETQMNIAGGGISGNTAHNNGGGIYVNGASKLNVEGVTSIIGNEAGSEGGGIYTGDYSYVNPAEPERYGNITIASGVQVIKNKSGETFMPPSNDEIFLNFDGKLLTNDQINYRRPYTITVSKQVTGEYGNLKKDFTFTVYFTNSEGVPLAKNIEFAYIGGTISDSGAIAPEGGKLQLDERGEATFILRHGQLITIQNEHAAAGVCVVETTPAGYNVSFKDSENVEDSGTDGDTGLLDLSGDRRIDFVNERTAVAPTGVDSGGIGLLMLAVAVVMVAAVGGVIISIYLRRRLR